MTTGPEPGWYDDGHGKQRWWDGAGWTEHFIDLGDRDIELHAGAAPAGTAAGWYDDGRGRQRWWDGADRGRRRTSPLPYRPGQRPHAVRSRGRRGR